MTKYRIVEKVQAQGTNIVTTYHVEYRKLFFFWFIYWSCSSLKLAEEAIVYLQKREYAKKANSSKVIKVYNV